jgi:hypothetical protein
MKRHPSALELADRVQAFIRAATEGGECAEETFNALALELFQMQFAQVEPYRRLCLRRGATPDTVPDWQSIPAVPAVGFKEFELTSLPPAHRTRVFHSSGTSAHRPSRHFHGEDSLLLYEASLRAWFAPHLLPDDPDAVSAGPRFLALTPPPAAAPHSSLVHMFDSVMPGGAEGSDRRCFAAEVGSDGGWRVQTDQALVFLERAVEAGISVCVLGPAFSHVHLLEAMEARDTTRHLPPGSRLLETGGYKGRSRELTREDLQAWLTRRLGIAPSHIVGEYGMSELGSQAYSHVAGETPQPGAPVFRFPPWARVRVVSSATGAEVGTGETGLVQVFDLANVWSVMAVATDDLARRATGGFELLGRAPAAEPRGCSLLPTDLREEVPGP